MSATPTAVPNEILILLVVLEAINLNCDKTCQYDTRKYSFCHRVVYILNSLLDNVVEADSINFFNS